MVDASTLVEQAHADRIDRLVVGVIVQVGERVLLLERPAGDFLGGLYELPGGQVEEGESLQSATVRELLEETGLVAMRTEEYLGHFDYPSSNGLLTRQFNFRVAVQDATQVHLMEHNAYLWVGRTNLAGLPVSPEVLALLEKVLPVV